MDESLLQGEMTNAFRDKKLKKSIKEVFHIHLNSSEDSNGELQAKTMTPVIRNIS